MNGASFSIFAIKVPKVNASSYRRVRNFVLMFSSHCPKISYIDNAIPEILSSEEESSLLSVFDMMKNDSFDIITPFVFAFYSENGTNK